MMTLVTAIALKKVVGGQGEQLPSASYDGAVVLAEGYAVRPRIAPAPVSIEMNRKDRGVQTKGPL